MHNRIKIVGIYCLCIKNFSQENTMSGGSQTKGIARIQHYT